MMNANNPDSNLDSETWVQSFQKCASLSRCHDLPPFIIIIIIIIFIIDIQPLGRSGQRPELSQRTGMALVRCNLGKFLGVACHCFPPLFRCSHFSPPGASTSAMA